MKLFTKQNILTFLVVYFLFIPSIFPLYNKGFFVGDDGEWMIIRFTAFHQTLVSGQFPVRFVSRLNYEYGYPVTNFLYPGYMYLAEPIHLLHIGFIDTVKIIFGLSFILSAVFAYFWLAKLFSRWGAILGSFVFLYMPYHLVDMYQRGSVGELLAIAVLPFILWNIERKSLLFSSLGIALLILSHNTLAALFLPLIVLYSFVRSIEKKHYSDSWIFLVVALGLGAATFFWFPALYDLQYTIFSQTKISEWQKYFAATNTIGIINIVLLGSSGILLFVNLLKHHIPFISLNKHKNMFFLFTIVGLFSIFFSSSISKPLWNILPVSFIQFPFRFLSLEIISVSFVTAFIFESLQSKWLKALIFVVILIVFSLSARPYYSKLVYFDKGDAYYATNEDSTTVKNEYMPKWVKVLPQSRPQEKIEGENMTISNLVINASKIVFTETVSKPAVTTINTIYFPGWIVKEDGKELPISYNNPRGLISFIPSLGTHRVEVVYRETIVHLLSDAVSLISSLILIFLGFKNTKLFSLKYKK